ncbi:hypothetical protein FRC07_010507 [Ceratobasidium sp. 392]|nr:hypothetical protein FRC07_010507 [Ceratobasidium sp. 392]
MHTANGSRQSIVREVCIVGRLDMRKTISFHNKPRLQKVYNTIIELYPCLLEFDDPYWVPNALVYVVLKSSVDSFNHNKRSIAKPKSPLTPRTLEARLLKRRAAARKGALARVAARRAAKALNPAAQADEDNSVESLLNEMNDVSIAEKDEDDEMDVDSPIPGPVLAPVNNEQPVAQAPTSSSTSAADPFPAIEPSADHTAADVPAPQRHGPRARALAPSAASAPTLTSVSAPESATIVSASATTVSVSAPTVPTSSTAAPSVTPPAADPAPAPSAQTPAPIDDDIAALKAAGKEACSRFSSALFDIGPPGLLSDDDLSDAPKESVAGDSDTPEEPAGSLSDAPEEPAPRTKGAKGGAKLKASKAASAAKSITTGTKATKTGTKAARTASTSKSAAATTTATKGTGRKAKATREPATTTTTRSTRASSKK